jgi:hypothetical protein
VETIYTGGCHCGRIRFRVSAKLENVSFCNCSICEKKGFWHWIVAPDAFELLSGADAVSEYRFNTGTAVHRFCKHCGIHSFYTPRSDPDKVSVNARCLDGVDLAALAETLRFFDGQNWEKALKQRNAR